MITRSGPPSRPWALTTSTGRVYYHKTKHAAEAQESAINLSKARAAGHRVPRRPARKLKGGQWERLYHRRGRR